MTVIQQILSIAIAAVANFFTRVSPFLIFDHSNKKGSDEISPFIEGLGRFLPPAIMGMLVVYCFRDVNFLAASHGLPDIIATIITVLVHLWRRNMSLSLLVRTVAYILLVNFVF